MSAQRGPDLVLAGAARSGTTLLAGRLGVHPGIVSPSIKEPNYFSSRLDRGYPWYAALYPAQDGLWLDASAQYTLPRYLDALDRIAALSPQVRMVYIARDPVQRAYSHYCHEVLYMGKRAGVSFATAVNEMPDVAGGSDYAVILDRLQQAVPPDRLLVLPFEFVTADLGNAAATVWSFAGLDPDVSMTVPADDLFENQSAVIRNPIIRRAFNKVRSTRAYPHIRRVLGAERVRAARVRLTSSESIPPLSAALRECSASDLELLEALRARSANALEKVLTDQDRRLGTDLLSRCTWLAPA